MDKFNIDEKWLYEHMPDVDALLHDQHADSEHEDHIFSDRYQELRKKLLKKESHAMFYSFTRPLRHKAAIIILFVLIGFSTLTLSVGAFREYIFEKIIQSTERLKTFNFDVPEETHVPLTDESPAYLPEGFALTGDTRTDASITKTYKNRLTTEEFIFQKKLITDTLTVQTTGQYDWLEHITINQSEADFFYADYTYTIMYQKNGYLYVFTGFDITKEDMLAITESLTEELDD